MGASMNVTGPDPDILELTKQIVAQNEVILKMNADLLAKLMTPLRVLAEPEGPSEIIKRMTETRGR